MRKNQIRSLRLFVKKQPTGMLLAISIIIISLFSSSVCLATTDTELVTAFELMQSPNVSSERVLAVSDYTIEHHDFSLTLESGLLYLYDPIRLDSNFQEWGGLFVGRAKFKYKPIIPMEVDQLKRFYGRDSLTVSVFEIELIFGEQLFDQLQENSELKQSAITDRVKKSVDEHHQFLAGRQQISYLYEALKGIAFPGSRPFLIANAALGKFGQTVYTFDPYAREEVSLKLHSWDWAGGEYLDLVTNYSQYSSGTLATINGMDKDQLKVSHYDLEMTFTKESAIAYETTVKAVVTKPTQMVKFELNYDLEVSEIIWLGHGEVKYKRTTDKQYKQNGLWLFFDQELTLGDSLNIMVKSAKELPARTTIGYAEIVGGSWYPSYNSQPATFEMNFQTPAAYTFVLSGKMLNKKTNKDKRISNWSIAEPVSNVSFAIGTFEKHELLEENAVPVEVCFDPGLHVELAYDSREDTTIAQDLANSLKLFAYHFGPFKYSKLVATELPGFPGEVFPGLVNLELTAETDKTDRRADDRYSRAYETATQWWGGAIGQVSYHESWLAESFAEYSALMYLQATEGNHKFLEKLGNYRDQIFLTGDSYLASNVESSSVMLGARAASTETDRQARLVIYKKGAFVLHMLRNLLLDLTSMSDEKFQALMREWYRTLKGRSATTYEFKQLVDKYVGEDMSWFFDQYLLGRTLPIYHFSYETELLSDGHTAITCHLEQTGVAAGFKMYVPIEIEFATGNRIYMRLLVDQLSGDIELPLVKGVVRTVTFNPFHSVLGRVELR